MYRYSGILHLMLVPSSVIAGIQYATFFLISGLLQLFWVSPMVKRWGRIWNIIGFAGTVVLVGLTGYVVIESVRNPQSTPPGITELAVAIENISDIICYNYCNNYSCQKMISEYYHLT